MVKKSRWKEFVLMKRSHVLLLTITTSMSLLLLQLSILRYFMRVHESVVTTDEERSLRVTGIVCEEGEMQGVHLFIADDSVLRSLRQSHGKRVLAHDRKSTIFASLGHLSTPSQKEKFFSNLLSKGMDVFVADGHDPNLRRHGLKVKIPYTAFISSDDHVVVVHFLYARPGKYWWQGAFEEGLWNMQAFQRILANTSNTFIDNKFENAYDPFEIYPATVDGIQMFLPASLENAIDPGPSTRFVDCPITQAKLFYEKHKPNTGPEADEFRKKAWALLSKSKNILDELKIPFWLSSGTCLGYFRQCDFITYSKDVDLGVRIEDFDPKMAAAFSTNGLPLTHRFGKVRDSLELSFRDGDIKLDVFFFYEERDHVWNGGTQARTARKFKYIFPKFELCWTEFLELRVRVPCTTLEYLEANYGQNWTEPVRVWDWKKSPPNVRENGQWPVEEWGEVIRLMSLPET